MSHSHAGGRGLASVIIPCLNESQHIGECIESLLEGDTDGQIAEVLVVDGMSSDGTREVVQRLQEKFDSVRLLDNPDRFVPHAMNRGIRAARGRFIVRADAHALYPPGYVRELLAQHDNERVANAGGVLENIPGDDTPAARVICAAMGSRFGVGRSFRNLRGTEPRNADTVPFGCWRAELFDRVGMFDESFRRAQDLEFNVRCRSRGYAIRCVPSVVVRYRNRSSFGSLFRMMYQTGYWKVRVNARHHRLSSLRQLAPLGVCLAVVAGALLTAILPRLWFAWNVPLFAWALGALVVSARESIAGRAGHWTSFFLLGYCFAGMHGSYAAGYASGIARRLLRRESGAREYETTR